MTDLIKEFKSNPKKKRRFLASMNQLGFPLEFGTRAKLKKKGFIDIREGNFLGRETENAGGVMRSYDIHARKEMQKRILKNVTINMDLVLIGDCKYSNDSQRFLLAVPEIKEPDNTVFVGPILSNFQRANKGIHGNSYTISDFRSRFGDLEIVSDIREISIDCDTIAQQKESKKPDYERVYHISEDTILPPVKEHFIKWIRYAYHDYELSLSTVPPNVSPKVLIDEIEGQYHSAKLILPFIVTSKKIIVPRLNSDYEITDISETPFALYLHSSNKPWDFVEILRNYRAIGIFVVNDAEFDKFLNYAEGIFKKIFNTVVHSIGTRPHRLVREKEIIENLEKEIFSETGRHLIPPRFTKQPRTN